MEAELERPELERPDGLQPVENGLEVVGIKRCRAIEDVQSAQAMCDGEEEGELGGTRRRGRIDGARDEMIERGI